MMNRLILQKSIYEWDKIARALDAYSSMCDLNVEEQDYAYVLSVVNCKIDSQIIIKEFENYLIGISGAYGF